MNEGCTVRDTFLDHSKNFVPVKFSRISKKYSGTLLDRGVYHLEDPTVPFSFSNSSQPSEVIGISATDFDYSFISFLVLNMSNIV